MTFTSMGIGRCLMGGVVAGIRAVIRGFTVGGVITVCRFTVSSIVAMTRISVGVTVLGTGVFATAMVSYAFLGVFNVLEIRIGFFVKVRIARCQS